MITKCCATCRFWQFKIYEYRTRMGYCCPDGGSPPTNSFMIAEDKEQNCPGYLKKEE